MGSIRASWALSARLGRVRGVLWVHLGKSEGVWETSWRRLGSISGCLGRILEGIWGVLEAFWGHTGSIFGRFSVSLSNMRK